jgi:hypothetical protein
MKPDIRPVSKYQLILELAKRTGTVRDFDSLPPQKWDWPTGTFLQRRLAELRKRDTDREQ